MGIERTEKHSYDTNGHIYPSPVANHVYTMRPHDSRGTVESEQDQNPGTDCPAPCADPHIEFARGTANGLEGPVECVLYPGYECRGVQRDQVVDGQGCKEDVGHRISRRRSAHNDDGHDVAERSEDDDDWGDVIGKP